MRKHIKKRKETKRSKEKTERDGPRKQSGVEGDQPGRGQSPRGWGRLCSSSTPAALAIFRTAHGRHLAAGGLQCDQGKGAWCWRRVAFGISSDLSLLPWVFLWDHCWVDSSLPSGSCSSVMAQTTFPHSFRLAFKSNLITPHPWCCCHLLVPQPLKVPLNSQWL